MPSQADPWLVERLSKLLNDAIYETKQSQGDED